MRQAANLVIKSSPCYLSQLWCMLRR